MLNNFCIAQCLTHAYNYYTIAVPQLYAHHVAMTSVINSGMGSSAFESTEVKYKYKHSS